MPNHHLICLYGGRIIDNLQIDNLQIDNRQIDNRQIDNLTNIRQIDNLSFSKINSAIPLSWPHELGNWHHGVVIFIMGEVRPSNSFILASWVRKLAWKKKTNIFTLSILGQTVLGPQLHNFNF